MSDPQSTRQGQSKRIGYLVSQYPAASHTFIRREVEAMRARGLDIHTFSVRPKSPEETLSPHDEAEAERTFRLLPPAMGKVFAAHGAAVLSQPSAYFRTLLAAWKQRAPGTEGLGRAVFHFAEAIVLARELRRRGITHLHNHFANAGANVGYLATRFLELPWSLTLHGISETDYPAGLSLYLKIGAADFVACVSHFGRAQAMRTAWPDQWHKLFISRCGLDLAELPARSPRADRKTTRVICVGRLSPEKGHAGLLDAFATVAERGHDAELVLVGEGPLRWYIETWMAKHPNVRVTMLGQLPEEATLQQIAQSDVLVLASFMEGLPVVLMEAMALGVAAIGPRVAGVPELIEEGREGLLFSPSAFDELATCLERVITDPNLREQLGRAGRAKIEAEFEIGKATAALAQRFIDA